MSSPSALSCDESFTEIFSVSSLDGSREPSLLSLPPNGEAKALVVGLHTWSAERFTPQASLLPFCLERGWALLLPEFRGPNLVTNPRAREAGGSALARRDIVDATRVVLSEHFSDSAPPVFLHGGSGGGHMGLMTAACEDFPWKAVSSWCPVTDLAAWHEENADYRPHVAAVCGGAPGPKTEEEYRQRSPLHYAEALSKHRLLLAHGRHDQPVSYRHSWKLAQKIEACRPQEFYFQIFDGGHEIHDQAAFAFFDRCLDAGTRVALTG
jgi:dipeptidyl aminopeptidase/acylaminoacyl peptidase